MALVSLILVFGILELGIRIYWGEYRFHNSWEVNRNLFRSAYPAEFHQQLGWIPIEGYVGDANVWGTHVTILQDGIRANSKESIPISREEGDLILAIGDSYTFGDMVSDHETWPARLEGLSGIRTLNGGVFGYAVDQTYLRMRILDEQYRPTHIVMSLIPCDILRCELSERTAVPKPYFEIVDNTLVLRDGHITEKPAAGNGNLLGRTLGYSFLTHKLMLQAFPEYWLQGSQRTTQVHSDGAAVTCLLMKEIESFLKATPSVKKFYLLI